MKVTVEIVEVLMHKLCIFGVSIDSPTSVFCDNKAIHKNIVLPESILSTTYHSIAYHMCQKASAVGTIQVIKEGTTINIVDLFIKLLSEKHMLELLEHFV